MSTPSQIRIEFKKEDLGMYCNPVVGNKLKAERPKTNYQRNDQGLNPRSAIN
jgi:hypothetical protein